MFKFSIDNDNATITVMIIGADPGPRTTMYYPRDGVVELLGDVFTIDGKLYTPTVENTELLGRKIRIDH